MFIILLRVLTRQWIFSTSFHTLVVCNCFYRFSYGYVESAVFNVSCVRLEGDTSGWFAIILLRKWPYKNLIFVSVAGIEHKALGIVGHGHDYATATYKIYRRRRNQNDKLKDRWREGRGRQRETNIDKEGQTKDNSLPVCNILCFKRQKLILFSLLLDNIGHRTTDGSLLLDSIEHWTSDREYFSLADRIVQFNHKRGDETHHTG